MTRPIDIRDLARRDAELTDARLGLDEDNNLAMTNQPDNSTIGTAASRDVGTAPDQIPLNSGLGSASLADTGTATGEIPTADILFVVGETNWSTGNYQPETLGGLGVPQIMGNASGITITANSTVLGSALVTAVFLSGVISGDSFVSGSWLSLSDNPLMNGNFGMFVRTA